MPVTSALLWQIPSQSEVPTASMRVDSSSLGDRNQRFPVKTRPKISLPCARLGKIFNVLQTLIPFVRRIIPNKKNLRGLSEFHLIALETVGH